jgi:hypothetical protein
VSLAGRPVSELDPPPDAAWVLRGDRGITYADTMPADSRLVAGQWWAPGYDGPPLVSFAAELAEALEIGSATRSKSMCWAGRSPPRSPICAPSTGSRYRSTS